MASLESRPAGPARTLGPEDGVRLAAQLSGGAFHLRVKYSVVQDLSAFLAANEGGAYGLLCGRRTPDGAAVEESVARRQITGGSENTQWQQAVAHLLEGIQHDSEAASMRPVGLFRSQSGGWPALTESDCRLLRRCAAWLPDQGPIFLVIRTFSHRPRSAALFVCGDSGPTPQETPLLEFPFDEYLLRQGYLAEPPAPVEPPSVEPITRKRSPLPWVVAAGVLALSAGGGYLFLRSHPEVLQSLVGRPSPEEHLPATTASVLSLHAGRSGSDIELSWDRSSPIIQSASSATLTIRDGPMVRAVALSGEQLREGRILYAPMPQADVGFRLEVIGTDGTTTAESVQILGWDTKSAEKPADAASLLRQRAETPRSITALTPGQTTASPAQERPPLRIYHLTPTPEAVRRPSAELPAPPAVNPQSSHAPPSLVGPAAAAPAMPRPAAASAVQATVPATSQPAAAKTLPIPTFPPSAIRQTQPVLGDGAKEELRKAGGAVNVTVWVKIDANGKVTEAKAMPLEGKIPLGGIYLKMAATNAAKLWRFRPALVRGKAVPGEMNVTFTFRP